MSIANFILGFSFGLVVGSFATISVAVIGIKQARNQALKEIEKVKDEIKNQELS